MKIRPTVAGVIATLALSVSLFAFAGTPGAGANTGDNIQAGRVTTEDKETVVNNTNQSVADCTQETNGGLQGCGETGLEGFGTYNGVNANGSNSGVTSTGGTYGVWAYGTSYGVYSHTASGTGVYGSTDGSGQNGVFGYTHNSNGSGVYGQNDGTGYGVAGRASSANGGTGVLGDAPNSANGVGVEADSASGIALHVNGKVVFSRSGFATVPSGATKIKVNMPGVSAASMVFAMVQQTGAFYVKSAVPASGSLTIYINKAPVSPATVKVAYFVLN